MKISFDSLLSGIRRFVVPVVILFSFTASDAFADDSSGNPSAFMVRADDFSSYLKEAEEGDSEGMRHLAICYQLGVGVDKDLEKAWEWYGRAAKNGNHEAQYDIGVLYRDGIGTERNHKESAYWFRKAASNGHAEAMVNIARQFAEGDGVLQDYRIAAENYWRAAERGNAEGAYYYAVLLRDGLGVKKNPEKALRYFRQAADAGFKDAGEQATKLTSSKAVKSSRHSNAAAKKHNAKGGRR